MPPGVTRNERVLVGFAKVRVAAGQQVVATVTVETIDLGRYDPQTKEWLVDSGEYTLFAQECAGSRWDGYLADVAPIPNPPETSAALERAPRNPTWQGNSCVVMGSVKLTIE
jgi:hypothetical protein